MAVVEETSCRAREKCAHGPRGLTRLRQWQNYRLRFAGHIRCFQHRKLFISKDLTSFKRVAFLITGLLLKGHLYIHSAIQPVDSLYTLITIPVTHCNNTTVEYFEDLLEIFDVFLIPHASVAVGSLKGEVDEPTDSFNKQPAWLQPIRKRNRPTKLRTPLHRVVHLLSQHFTNVMEIFGFSCGGREATLLHRWKGIGVVH